MLSYKEIEEKLEKLERRSYCHCVLAYDDLESFPEVGVSGKLYVDVSTTNMYIWHDNAYLQIGIIPT
jgi:hypothetical protein